VSAATAEHVLTNPTPSLSALARTGSARPQGRRSLPGFRSAGGPKSSGGVSGRPPAGGGGDRPPTRRWPQSFAALQVRDYRLYLTSQMVATTGLWMQRIAQDWLVLELTGSVTAVGVAVALQFLPMLLFGLLGGVVADRFPKRTILIVTQSTAATVAITLGTLALTGTVQAWHVYVPVS
jgi:hypothetical protein